MEAGAWSLLIALGLGVSATLVYLLLSMPASATKRLPTRPVWVVLLDGGGIDRGRPGDPGDGPGDGPDPRRPLAPRDTPGLARSDGSEGEPGKGPRGRRAGEPYGELHRKAVALSGLRARLATARDRRCLVRLREMCGVSPKVSGTLGHLVADRDGKVEAVLPYGMEPGRLCLGPLISDPLTQERPLARLLYAEAVILAREAGLTEVRSAPVSGDYQYEVGYRRGWSGWRMDTGKRLRLRRELPDGGWRRALAIWGAMRVDVVFERRKRSEAEAGCSMSNLGTKT